MTRIISSLSEITQNYDAVLCDLWGCLHDGISALPEAVEALQKYRSQGGKVVLVTNAPRPRHEVEVQITEMGVPHDCWDTIATSGDGARLAMFQGAVGSEVYFIGEVRDLGFFEPIHLLDDCLEIRRVPLDQATGIVCTGPSDPLADPAVHRPELLFGKQKGLTLLCANPDVIVDKGESREWCAGAIAAIYDDMGGETLYFGKPYPPIYDLARRRLAEVGSSVSNDRLLAIGDGIATDVKGAMGEDIDSLFVSGGLAATETKTSEHPDASALKAFIAEEMMTPTFTIGKLR
jgi:HAD superfamily hydrolase (TIGR01459 family)